MLTELVNTLVTALGQNAANATSAIPPGIPLANAGGEEGLPPQEKGGKSQQAMPRLTLTYVEGALDVGFEQGMKIEEMC